MKPRTLVFSCLAENIDPPDDGAVGLERFLAHGWNVSFRSIEREDLFARIKEEELKALFQRALLRDVAYRGVRDLRSLLGFSCPDAIALPFADALRGSGKVLYADLGTATGADLPYELRPISSATDQGYLEAAPEGIDARYAWSFPGGRGNGVRLVDLEGAWNLEHADLIEAGITLIDGVPATDKISVNHGTAVLGVIAAADDGRCVVGIAPEIVSARVVSLQHGDFVNLPRAILLAIRELRFGDVLLIEVHSDLGEGFVPVEAQRSVFDLVRLATARGVVVIEPAGNGGKDLDDLNRKENGSTGARPLDRRHPSFRDSGALVVAGCLREAGHPLAPRSNRGSRVDCHAWAEQVLTTWDVDIYTHFAYGGCWITREFLQSLRLTLADDELVRLIQYFKGTSSASAIIAGVAVCVQSLAQANLGFRLSPWQLRLLLSDPANGTLSEDDPEATRMGVMPDLRKIVDRVLRLAAGLATLFEPLAPPAAEPSREILIEASSPERIRAPDTLILPFRIECRHRSRRLRVEVLSRLPREARIWLEMPGALADLDGISKDPEVPARSMGIFVPANPNGQTYFRDANFPRESAWRLIVEIPRALRTRRYEVAVRVLSRWEEVGRMTWKV